MTTIKATNYSGAPFAGFIRCNVDSLPPLMAGRIGPHWYVIGNPTGLDTWACDVWCEMADGESLQLELDDAAPMEWQLPAPPSDPVAYFGGPLTLDGEPMEWVSLQPDGAAWVSHLHKRVGPMLHVDVWLTWYPTQPGVARGEAMVTCSNVANQFLFADVPSSGLSLLFGRSLVIVHGRGHSMLATPGTTFADGQARVIPITVVWPGLAESVPLGHVNMGVAAVGVERVHPWGNPTQQVNGRRWATQTLPRALAVMHTWDAPACGIAPNSTQTGAQEDQLFVRGEALDYPGAVWPTYLSALKFANRPCHHLEASGFPIKPEDHPNCVFWHSRPHWHKGISPDQLGKPKDLAPWDVPGEWFGPDREHWLVSTLGASNRLYSTPAQQRLLDHQAIVFLMQETTDPRLSTSHTDAARSVGYAGLVAVELFWGLADRDLAERVRQRWLDRASKVYVPEIGASAFDVWDPRADDRILYDVNRELTPEQAWPKGVMWWQQSLGCYGLDLAGEMFGYEPAREIARRGALAVLQHAWRQAPDGGWQFWENTGINNQGPAVDYTEGRGAHRTGWFDRTWAVPGLAVVLRHDPEHQQARAIWGQVASDGGSWVPAMQWAMVGATIQP